MKGSFTGAIKDKKGLFEAANGGTLFLDEIGDTSPQMQVKLLRVLQEGTFTPVGSTEVKKSNVRVLAATNKPLMEMISTGEFREDLFYRLNVINVQVPALKDRKEDIPLLVNHFLKNNAQSSKTTIKKLTGDLLQVLLNHDWPGNVRELEMK
jgi:two-component system response regulator HupR/HoxA